MIISIISYASFRYQTISVVNVALRGKRFIHGMYTYLKKTSK